VSVAAGVRSWGTGAVTMATRFPAETSPGEELLVVVSRAGLCAESVSPRPGRGEVLLPPGEFVVVHRERGIAHARYTPALVESPRRDLGW